MKSALLSLLIISLFINQSINAQAGKPDRSFGVNGISKIYVPLASPDFRAAPAAIVQRSDGKYYVIIIITETFDKNTAYLYRLYNNGNVDSDFGIDGRIALHPYDSVYNFFAMALDANDNIYTLSSSYLYNKFRLSRYTPYGSLDESFGEHGFVNFYKDFFFKPVLKSLVILPDGKILFAANTSEGSKQTAKSIIYRLNSNGSFDSSFNGKGFLKLDDDATGAYNTIDLQPGKRFLFSQQKIHRFNIYGSQDLTFGTGGSIKGDSVRISPNNYYHEVFSNIQTLANGGFYCTGTTSISSGLGGYTTTDKIYKFTKYGHPDVSFNGTGRIVLDSNALRDFSPVGSLLLQPDDKILLDSDYYGAYSVAKLTRYNTNGKIDRSFGKNGHVFFKDFIAQTLLQKDNKIVIAFLNITYNHPDTVYIERLKNDIDSSVAKETGETADALAAHENLLSISPNPVVNVLNIKGLANNAHLSVINAEGKVVATATALSDNYKWNIQSLPAGNYFLRVEKDNENIASIQFIKQ